MGRLDNKKNKIRRERMNGFLKPEEIDEILNGNSALLVEKAECVGKAIAKPVSSSQVRAIFGTIKKLQMSAQKGEFGEKQIGTLTLLIPKLYYAAKRSGKKEMEKLRDDLSTMIRKVKDKERFICLCNYLEAILAYHKAFGGK